MIGPLIALALQNGPVFPQFFPNPTGRNGAEEYVRAVDIVNAPEYAPYAAWSAEGGALEVPTIGISSRRAGATVAPRAPGSAGVGYLTLCEQSVGKFGYALSLIKAGNGKAVMQSVDFATLSVPLSNLTNLGLRAAHLRFAQAKPGEAVGYLLDQVTFLDNLQRSDTGGRPSTAGEGAVIQAFAQHIDGLGLGDCRQVSAFAKSFLARPPALRTTYVLRKLVWRKTIADYVARAKAGSTTDSIGAMVAKLSPQEKERVLSDAYGVVESAVGQALRTLDGPESAWALPVIEEPDPPTSIDALPKAIAMYAHPLAFANLRYDLAFRTRLRILDLTAQCRTYWYENGRYPKTFTELRNAKIIDPLSGKEFTYHHDKGTILISSAGSAASGEIFLDPNQSSSARPN